MKFTVTLQPHAEADLDEILERLNEKSPRGAVSWLEAWNQARANLAQHANSYGAAAENDDHEIYVQQILFRTRYSNYYRAIFTIVDNAVHVLHIRGSGQDLVSPDELVAPDR